MGPSASWPLLTDVPHREVEVDLVTWQRNESLELVVQDLREVLARRGGKDHAVERGLAARDAEVGPARIDAVLAREGRDRLREGLPALARPAGAGQRKRRGMAERHAEETFGYVGERDLVRADVDPETIQEVGTSEALRELPDGHTSPPVPPSPLPGSGAAHGARSNQRRMRTPSLACEPTSATHATRDWLRLACVSPRASM